MWLEQAYAAPIATTDTGIVSRSLNFHRSISTFLAFTNIQGRILDWGSGSGLFVRLLRDDGHDCYGLEPYTSPILAAGHTFRHEHAAIAKGPYRLIVATEVVEHLLNPKLFFEKALSISDTLIFSTELVDRTKNGSQWWYYSFETGQHINFYTEKSLSCLANINGCSYDRTRDKALHIITRDSSDLRFFNLLVGKKRSHILYPITKFLFKISGKKSFQIPDYVAAKAALRSVQCKSSE
jgi:hypothetical protein